MIKKERGVWPALFFDRASALVAVDREMVFVGTETEGVYQSDDAAQALGWIGSAAATSVLADVLEDDSPGVWQEAAWALGEIGDPAARDALARVQRRDPSAAVQAEAGLALAQLEASSASAPGWTAALASALNEFQALRWLVLGLSLAGAAWLVLGNPQRTVVPVFNRW